MVGPDDEVIDEQVEPGGRDDRADRADEPKRFGPVGRIALTGLGIVAVLVLALLVMAALSVGPFSTRDAGAVPFDGVRTGFAGGGDRTLVLSFDSSSPPEQTAGDPCWRGYRADATGEQQESVAVTLDERGPSLWSRMRNSPAECIMPGYQRLAVVELTNPLGSRRVLDGSDGHPMPVFDGSTLLRPTNLPAGWTLQREDGTVIDGAPSWVRTFGTVDPLTRVAPAPGQPVQWVSVTQAGPTRPAVEPGTRIDGHPTVRGVTAEYYDQGSVRSLTWDENGQRILLTNGAANGSPLLDEDELIALAEGLVPEG